MNACFLCSRENMASKKDVFWESDGLSAGQSLDVNTLYKSTILQIVANGDSKCRSPW